MAAPSTSVTFTLLVNTGPYQHQAADSAFRFAEAALSLGHRIRQIFFYHDGVYNASRLANPPQDDRDVYANWARLNKDHGVELVFCSGAGARRGMLDKRGAEAANKDSHNAAAEFRAGSLVELIEAMAEAERLVVFGD